ncbi:NPCBM/NEW2 domain-containing protein [uncultured Deinococcus sp.]|uniref:NPCBM/NEW2 domain-containing protein n=1 Tax=uncultured Deinococcus sp. TaxID=158789 RepID=UPI0025DFAB08|nr:NPCBM/NEW2 domain-containing protein [uncultured Deinococcus sp.]
MSRLPSISSASARLVLLGVSLLLPACAGSGAPTGLPAGPTDTEVTEGHITTDHGLSGQGLILVSGDTPLSGATWTTATNGYGPVELNRSNGGPAASDGGPLTVAGVTSTRGYGVHAASSLSFATGSQCRSLSTQIGVDDEVGSRGTVRFVVRGDGVTLHDSGIVRGSDGLRTVTVDISGRNTVQLVVTDAGDGTSHDHANWIQPTLHGCEVAASSGPALTPEQFGARGDGVTDDTAALTALFRAMNTQSQPVRFGAGRTYRFHRTAPTQFTITRTGTTITGNGAVLKVIDTESVSPLWYGVRIAGTDITVQDLGVDFNRARRPGTTSPSGQTAWFIDGGSRNVVLRRVQALNSPMDGIYIRDLVSTLPAASASTLPTGIRLEGVQALNSGRNNLSIVSARDVTVSGGRFNGARGYGDGPWAGIDIEPNRGSDVYGNRNIVIDGAETSDNLGSGIDVAQLDNEGITIRNHASHRNGGAALFLSPSGTITVDGLRASSYGSITKAGVVAIVPSDRPGATVSLSNLEIRDTTGTKPSFFQNYVGTVTLNGLRASNVATKTVLGTYQPTAVSNVYLDGVRIR